MIPGDQKKKQQKKQQQQKKKLSSSPQHSTEAAVEEGERIFSKLIRSIEKQSGELKELLRVQERAAVSQAEELLERNQREMVELRRADAELERLSRTEDHVHFLQVWDRRELTFRNRDDLSCLYLLRTSLLQLVLFIYFFSNLF